MSFAFWILGILTGVLAAKVSRMIREKTLRLSWYHWIVGAGWYAGLSLIIAFITMNMEEGEPQAAGMSVLIFGGGLLVTGILLYRLLFKGRIDG